MQIGFTKGFDHAPFRVSVTLVDLTRWDKDYYFASGEELSTGKMLMNHLAAGVDFLPTDYMYLSLGYNFRKANEMKAAALHTPPASVPVRASCFPVSVSDLHTPSTPVRPVLSSSTRPTACKDSQVPISALYIIIIYRTT